MEELKIGSYKVHHDVWRIREGFGKTAYFTCLFIFAIVSI